MTESMLRDEPSMIKTVLRIWPFAAAIMLMVVLLSGGCKNDDGPTGPPAETSGGAMSFQSNKGNFSASGQYDTTATSGSGVGGFRLADLKRISLAAFRFNSATDADVIIVSIGDTAVVHTTTYSFTGSEESVLFHYYPHVDPNGSGLGYPYLLTSGSIVVTLVNQDSIRATFSGKGQFAVNPSDTITVANGEFNASLQLLTLSQMTKTLNIIQ